MKNFTWDITNQTATMGAGTKSKAPVPSYFGAKKKTTCAATGYIIPVSIVQLSEEILSQNEFLR